jgi:hypothetical protein
VNPADIENSTLKSFVTGEGEFGSGEIFVFPHEALSEDQWEFLYELSEEDRYPFVLATVENDKDTLRELFDEYEECLDKRTKRQIFPALFG